MDALDTLEAEGTAVRAEKRAARKTPEAKAKKNRGRAQKRRGYRAEKDIERVLWPFGYRRVPLSGALGGKLSGDLRREPVSALQIVECKRRQGCDRMLRAQLAQGQADFLVRVPGNGGEPLVVMTLLKLTQVLGEAGYGHAE